MLSRCWELDIEYLVGDVESPRPVLVVEDWKIVGLQLECQGLS